MSSEIAKEAQANAFLDYEPRTPTLSAIALPNLNPENKSRLRRELYQRLDQAKFSLDEVLLDSQQTLVEAYLPRKGRMPAQEEVAATHFGDPRTSGFKRSLSRALIRVDGRYYSGSQAVEVLKPNHFLYHGLLGYLKRFAAEETFRLVAQIDIDTVSGLGSLAESRFRQGEDRDITSLRLNENPYLELLKTWRGQATKSGLTQLSTLDDLNKAKDYPSIVASFCGALPMFYDFQTKVQRFYPTWPDWQNSEDIFSMARQILYLRKEIFNSLEKGQ